MVNTITATPMDAPMANSRITPMSMISRGDEPDGVGKNGNHPRQEQLAEGAPGSGQGIVRQSLDCKAMPLIFCTPWEIPIAKIRNGTSIE